MITRLMQVCARRPGPVLGLFALAMLAAGFAARALPKDALPDLADPEVVLIASAAGRDAAAVEAEVSQPLAARLEPLPGVARVRARSTPGMSFVRITLDAGADLAAVRGRVQAAIERGRWAAGVDVRLGPAAAATGWIYQYALVGVTGRPQSTNLRVLQDDTIKVALERLPGVAEVASVGGARDAFRVELDPATLAAAGLTSADVATALAEVRADGVGPAAAEAQLRATRLGAQGTPLPAVARVRLAPNLAGAAASFGSAAAIGGIVIAQPNVDVTGVIQKVEATLAPIRAGLPEGVTLVTVYDRSELIARAGTTLLRALGEEILVVSAVALIFLLHLRSALLPALTLPVVVMLSLLAFFAAGVPITIMSLGGIAISLGMAVDAELVMLDSCHKRLEAAPPDLPAAGRRRLLVEAARELTPATVISLLIAAALFLPVFAFGGETGRVLRPLAFGKTAVVLAAALVSVTLAPALRDGLLRGRLRPESANPLSRVLQALYRPVVRAALERPRLTLGIAALAVLSCVPIVGRLGGEFMPAIDEGDLLYMPSSLPGASAHGAARELEQMNAELLGFGEVDAVFGKLGRADSASDPAPPHMIESNVRLRPRTAWPRVVTMSRWHSGWSPGWPAPLGQLAGRIWPERRARTLAELQTALDAALGFVGWSNAWTMPIRGRSDMLATGVRTAVGVRVHAASAARVRQLGRQVKAVLGRVAGTRSVVDEGAAHERALDLEVDPAALARHGVELTRLRAVVAGAAGPPREVGAVAAGPERFAVLLTHARDVRNDPVAFGQLPVPTVDGRVVPIGLLGQVVLRERPTLLEREGGALVQILYVDLVDGRDIALHVADTRAALEEAQAAGALAPGPLEGVSVIGQAELISKTRARLVVVLPLLLALALGLLYLLLRRLTAVLIVALSVPCAITGSVWLIHLLGYRLSAAVAVGLLALVGLAMQTGVIMVMYLDQAFYRRLRADAIHTPTDIVAAHLEGSVQRLRPKLMTTATMLIGLLPLLWADGAGAEIVKRIAAPMVGGLFTSVFLTLEVLPVLQTRWRCAQLERARRAGRPVAEVVGPPPVWARS